MSRMSDLWEPAHFRLFLSHTSRARKRAGELKKCLRRYAVDAFIAHEDIEPTKEWEREILRALDSCHALAALLSPSFHDSYWTDQEVGYALSRGVLLVPIMRQGLDPYGFMARYQGLRGRSSSSEDLASELFAILAKHKLTSAQIARAVVAKVVDSGSYDESGRNIGLLEDLPHLTRGQLAKIKQATENKRQIRESFTVPSKVRTLANKHR